jgi:short-subunit dehydrogenase
MRSAEAACYAADLSVDSDIDALMTWICKELVHVDILVHSAGEFAFGPVISTPVEALDRLYRINLRAPYVLTQKLLPLLRERSGQVVFINSSAGLRAGANVSHYAATKYALRGMADSLRDEVSIDGVTVLSVYPGRTATPMQARVHELEGCEYDPEMCMKPEDVAKQVVTALRSDSRSEVTEISICPRRRPDPTHPE